MSAVAQSSSYRAQEAAASAPSIHDLLQGPQAFYSQPDYLDATAKDLSSSSPLPTTYTWNTKSKVSLVAGQILSVIIFPIGIYHLLHALIGKVAILPASSPSLMGCFPDHADRCRKDILADDEWKYKRITVEVDGYKIDAMIVGKPSTFGNGRWLMASNGNGEFYEDKIAYSRDIKTILGDLSSNAVFFNYPGVGASTGLPNKQAMAKAYRAMFSLLHDTKNGMGAREVITYSHSLGGGVEGTAIPDLKFDKNTKYVFVKSRTFSSLKAEVSALVSKAVSPLIQLFGWNMDSAAASKQLKAPEIILQRANVKGYQELSDSSKIVSDGVIPSGASLAKALLDDPQCPRTNKTFIGMRETHNVEFIDPSFIAAKIETALASQHID
jgi:hypothetical protein